MAFRSAWPCIEVVDHLPLTMPCSWLHLQLSQLEARLAEEQANAAAERARLGLEAKALREEADGWQQRLQQTEQGWAEEQKVGCFARVALRWRGGPLVHCIVYVPHFLLSIPHHFLPTERPWCACTRVKLGVGGFLG